jgi:hypothetical protein
MRIMTAHLPLPAKASAADTAAEIELILCCARTGIDPAGAERIKCLLREEIDWGFLLRAARRHGVLPLLYGSLNATSPERVPEAALDQLRAQYRGNALRNLFLAKTLLEILQLLAAHQVLALPHRGPVLAAWAYGNLALREFSDLDILVHKKEVPKARSVLVSHGYHDYTDYPRFARGAGLPRSRYNLALGSDRFLLELHWYFAERHISRALDHEQLWGRLTPTPLLDTTVPGLAPEDTLLLLCVHGAKHRWAALKWVCDIAELLRVAARMDWGRVLEQADELGYARRLLLGVFLASDLLGAALPEDVLRRVRAEPLVRVLAGQVRAWLFPGANGAPGALERHRFHLRTRERLPDRARWVQYHLYRAVTPNERDYAFLPLPRFLSGLHYLIRPVRLLTRYRPVPAGKPSPPSPAAASEPAPPARRPEPTSGRPPAGGW